MATKRIPYSDDDPVSAPTGRGYPIGSEDMEEFVDLSPEEQRRLADTPGALDAWLAARATRYVQAQA